MKKIISLLGLMSLSSFAFSAELKCNSTYDISAPYTTCSINESSPSYTWRTNSPQYTVFYPSPAPWPYTTNNGVIRFLHLGQDHCPSGTKITVKTSQSASTYSYTCP